MTNKRLLLLAVFCFILPRLATAQNHDVETYRDQYRPQIHFSPAAHWINDPNGMVYFNHTYHLFFQYYPDATVWGPMHWGHATSTDLVHWKELPIALYPDSLGYIFSGSAVVDSNNTSGLGKKGKIPLVAIFTHHNPNGEKAGTNNYQNQSLAYSLDNGITWTKYAGNPVLNNPGIKDFRDPKVMWYARQKKWIMTLATKDRITFYSSPNLKKWKKESEFGATIGAHGGVWECPDLFPLKLNGKTHWVLIVNINPGGPNGGSATQYFTGDFNGSKFTPRDTKTRWLDYGPDEYAGITWGNTGSRKIFLGWMSNWEYANQVPTEKWRNAMTIPRELSLKAVNNEVLLASAPAKELNALTAKTLVLKPTVKAGQDILANLNKQYKQYRFDAKLRNKPGFRIKLSNDEGETMVIGYDNKTGNYYIDRSASGKTDFNPNFAKTAYAPRLAFPKTSDIHLIIDASSIEFFADGGLTTMTAVCFPHKPYTHLYIEILKVSDIVQPSVSGLVSIHGNK
ncbi:glycoside hydrolase family 32 protein [Mucilaginibacter celer]|uniref:Glycoside hydrolase family 32 protein n=2 Tax=Mucilaginibacter celer TaxID=2305508 RepID=A0A494VWC5_9SPHI|nr:glycoside hydrolase family 32 protein [Mucilaginibacter celer]